MEQAEYKTNRYTDICHLCSAVIPAHKGRVWYERRFPSHKLARVCACEECFKKHVAEMESEAYYGDQLVMGPNGDSGA
jgi:hypothetical protein